MGLQVPETTAERIKTRSGGLFATGMDDRDMIEVGGDTVIGNVTVARSAERN